MNDVALAMDLLGLTRLGREHKDIMLPLIAKTEGDRNRLLLKQCFESIVRLAGQYASELNNAANSPEPNREEVTA